MNVLDKNKYDEFRHILSGCRNKKDGLILAEKYISHNKDSTDMVYAMINGKKYNNDIDLHTFKSLLTDFYNMDIDTNERIFRNFFYNKQNINPNFILALNKIVKHKRRIIVP